MAPSECMHVFQRAARPAAATSCRSHHLALNSSQRPRLAQLFYLYFLFFFSCVWRRICTSGVVFGGADHTIIEFLTSTRVLIALMQRVYFSSSRRLTTRQSVRGFSYAAFGRVRLVAFCGRVCNGYFWLCDGVDQMNVAQNDLPGSLSSTLLATRDPILLSSSCNL
jgi:hypothetical protein